MKSHINKLTDYRTVPLEKVVTIPSPKTHVEKELRQLTRAHKRTAPVEQLEAGDVAYLKLESSLPRFCKKMLPLTVGSGLFSAELESQLPGRKVGEAFTATVEGEPVQVEILKASRTFYPEATDEMAAAYAAEHEEFADAATVEAYKAQVTKEYYRTQRMEALGEAMQTLMNEVLTTSDWAFDEEELEAFAQKMLAEETEAIEAEIGKKIADMTDEEFKRFVGFDSPEQMQTFCRNSSEQWIATILWCAHESGTEPSLEDANALSYQFLEDYVTNTITFKEEE